MPLQLLPMGPDELEHYETIVVAAFGQTLQSIFYPNGFSAAAKAHVVASEQALYQKLAGDVARQGIDSAVSLHYLKVVDTDLPADAPNGGIVGVSKWMIYPRTRTTAELEAEEAEALKKTPLPPGVNGECVAAFQSVLREAKRDIFGPDPYVILQVLVTHPDHHRRGVGAMHLQWGQDVADQRGLPIYLEASAMGKPLYERWGYEFVKDIPWDARHWGGKEEMRHVSMVRPAAKAAKAKLNGTTNGVVHGSNINGVVNGTAHGKMNGTMNGGIHGAMKPVVNGMVNGHMNGTAV